MTNTIGKIRIGKGYSSICYVDIQRKGDTVIIGTADTKFEINAEDLQKELNRDETDRT